MNNNVCPCCHRDKQSMWTARARTFKQTANKFFIIMWGREAVVRNSGVHPLGGLMCSYSALDGVPMCGKKQRKRIFCGAILC